MGGIENRDHEVGSGIEPHKVATGVLTSWVTASCHLLRATGEGSTIRPFGLFGVTDT